MYAASGQLVPVQPLSADRLTRVDVQLGDQAGRYLSAAAGVPSGAYILRDETSPLTNHLVTEVPVVALDDLQLARPVRLMKIDAEGAEPQG